jgi:hypothetical protein
LKLTEAQLDELWAFIKKTEAMTLPKRKKRPRTPPLGDFYEAEMP